MLNSIAQYTRDNIVQDVIVVEGGYSNDPADPGGETNFGITYRTAARYKAQLVSLFGWDGTMRNLTNPMAAWIYVQEYWNKMSGDGIVALGGYAPLIADMLFQAGVNIGPPVVGGLFQTVLNSLNNQQAYYADLKVDGNIGPMSVNSLKALLLSRPRDGLQNVLFSTSAEIAHRYTSISQQNLTLEKFVSGWMNRARQHFETYMTIYSGR